MATLIIILFIAGIMAGLVQYFVDFRGLVIFQPPQPETNAFDNTQAPDFWKRLLAFIKRNWQFFGYITVGIAGAFLVPVIHRLINLPGADDFLNCLGNEDTPACSKNGWYRLIILGYGIVSGYSSVRLIRSFGSFLLGNISKRQQDQQKQLEEAQRQISELTAKLPAMQPARWAESFMTQENNSPDDETARKELSQIDGFESCNVNPTPTPWTTWRAAESLKTLRDQVNALAPARSKASDGIIGDAAHQTRDSDHNPWVWDESDQKGVVTALDITHDPANNCDAGILAKSLENSKDSRIKYVIWNKQIMNASPINGTAAWTWRSYAGANPHTKHVHISVKCESDIYDQTTAWTIRTS